MATQIFPPSDKVGWIGFDLDGVLAEYHGAQNNFEIGPPIPAMVAKAKQLLAEGWELKIFTARVDGGLIYPTLHPEVDPVTVEVYRQIALVVRMVQDWTEKHLGKRLAVTCQKDAGMRMLYDDRCVQIESNTGRILGKDIILSPG
jgi:hypothetical protein